MVGRLAIKARQIQPGDAFAAAVPAGGLVEIVDLDGRQVAELVAFDQADPSERVSLGVTRQESRSIMLSLGMKVYSSRGRAMLDLVEDTVGRHDLLWTAPTGPVSAVATDLDPAAGDVDDASPATDAPVTTPSEDAEVTPAADSAEDAVDPQPAEPTASPDQVNDIPAAELTGPEAGADDVDVTASGTTASPVATHEPKALAGFAAALEPFGLSTPDVPDPINFFMQLAVMQRGDLELRAPLSERGDRVVLQALTDLVVAVRCSAATDETNGESPSDILVRIYR